MAYDSAIPQATDKLLTSQQQILANFASLQTTFTTDHYGFVTPSVAANIGKHKTITTPAEAAAPSAAADEPVMFALDLGTLGVVQLSRSENTAGSPNTSKAAGVTALHGTVASLAAPSTQNILDCTGLARCILEIYAYTDSYSIGAARGSLMWDGTSAFKGIDGLNKPGDYNQTGNRLLIQTDGSSTIQLRNPQTDAANGITGVYWTIHIRRYDV